MYKYLLILLLLSSCGKPPAYIDPIFAPYVLRFMHDTEIEVEGVGMLFGEVKPGIAAWCLKYTDGTKSVIVDRDYWNRIGEGGREELIYHELGHCRLNRKHSSELVNGCPLSIMFPSAFGDSLCYSRNRDVYVRKLIEGE